MWNIKLVKTESLATVPKSVAKKISIGNLRKNGSFSGDIFINLSRILRRVLEYKERQRRSLRIRRWLLRL